MPESPAPLIDPNQPRSIKRVWLLNLFPFFGFGYLYAVGTNGLKLMLLIWGIEIAFFSPLTLFWVYLILSVLGTAHLLKEQRIARFVSEYDTERGENIEENQVPLDRTTKFALPSHESDIRRVKRRIAQATDEDDKSRLATDLFEYKLRAAEKTLKARADQSDRSKTFDPDPSIDFAPANAPKFSDEEPDETDDNVFAPSAVPGRSASLDLGTDPASSSSGVSADFSYGIGDQAVASSNSFYGNGNPVGASTNSLYGSSGAAGTASDSAFGSGREVVVSLDSPTSSSSDLGASSASPYGSGSEVVVSLESNRSDLGSASGSPYGSGLPEMTDLRFAETSLPEPTSLLANSTSFVPDIASQYSSEPMALPTAEAFDKIGVNSVGDQRPSVSLGATGSPKQVAASSTVKSPTSAAKPGPSAVNPISDELRVPEVATQWDSRDVAVPEVSTMWANTEITVPEVSSQFDNKTFDTPDVSSQWTDNPINAPEVSAQYEDKPLFTPDVSSQWANNPISAPEVNAQYEDKVISTPDVNAQWMNNPISAPEVNAQYEDKVISTPDVNAQWVNNPISAPDVSAQYEDRSISAPDVSLEWKDTSVSSSVQATRSDNSVTAQSASTVPSFSLSFDDHLNSPASTFTFGAPATAEANCPKCGAKKDRNFSFCLACGQSFL